MQSDPLTLLHSYANYDLPHRLSADDIRRVAEAVSARLRAEPDQGRFNEMMDSLVDLSDLLDMIPGDWTPPERDESHPLLALVPAPTR